MSLCRTFNLFSDKRPIEILKVDENEITQQISEKLQRYMDDLREDKVTGKVLIFIFI